MEYYLPSDVDLRELEEAYRDPVDAAKLQTIREIIAENADDPRLAELYKVG